LKKKKERRKGKVKQNAVVESSTARISSIAPEEDEDESMNVDTAEVTGPSPPKVRKTNRKRSRQEEDDQEEMDDENNKKDDEDKEENLAEEDVDMAVDGEKLSSPRRSPTPDLSGALPSFPLPALPNAPSKSLLAMQGLTKELMGAELVSPSTILPIPAGKDDGGTRLSEKIRNRLRDIGITELFAGTCVQRRRPVCTEYSVNFSANGAFAFLTSSN
jgi:ATP-dependent RNA helicase DDX51/DBP6